MEPKYKEISLLDLRSMLRRWQKSGVTSAHCTKLLMLMIGERDLMGEDYGYHRKDFNALRIRMGFGNVNLLLSAVAKTEEFIVVRNVCDEIIAFYSPVFPPSSDNQNKESQQDIFKAEGVTDVTSVTSVTDLSLANNLNNNIYYADNNLNNNISKEKTVTSVTPASDHYQSWDFTPGEKRQPKLSATTTWTR